MSSPSGRYRSTVDFSVVSRDGSPVVSRTVLVASDVRLYSEGLALVFARDGRLSVTQVAESADATVARLGEGRADALLLDASMPGVHTVVQAVRDQVAKIPVVLFGVPTLDEDLLDCIDAGAATFVSRDATSEDLIEAVLSALRGESMQTRGLANVLERLANRARMGPQVPDGAALTARERELAILLDEGLSNKEIAQRLSISVATVKNHVHRILEKLNVQRRGQAASRLRQPMNPRI